jgi:hypothetical protein
MGLNLKVYVDDIMIKSQKGCSFNYDLEETFNNLQRFNIRLNKKNPPSGSLGESSWGTSLPNVTFKKTMTKSWPSQYGSNKECQGCSITHGMLCGPQLVHVQLEEHGLPLYKLLKIFDPFCWIEGA